MVKKLTFLLVIVVTIAMGHFAWETCATAQDDIDRAVDMVYRWSLPESGTTIVSWNIQIRMNGNDADVESIFLESATPEFTMTDVDYGATYEIRVQGIDATGIRGRFSMWSAVTVSEFDEPISPINTN